jgi:hypothetical protein
MVWRSLSVSKHTTVREGKERRRTALRPARDTLTTLRNRVRCPIFRLVCWLHHLATNAQHHGKVDHVERPAHTMLALTERDITCKLC